MTTNFILAPILIHLLTAILLLFFWQRVTTQKIISVAGNSIAFLFCIRLFQHTLKNEHLLLQVGNWKAPFGIIFISDTFSAIMVLLTAFVSLAVGIYSTAALNESRIKYGYFFTFHLLIMGLIGAFLTGDIFNLYVWFEVVIISSFILLTVGGKKMQMEGAIKYVTMNILASAIFLTAIGVLYGITGTLNIADISLKINAIENRGLISVTSLLFFIGFGIKSAIFPLYFWLPSSYHTPPSAIASIFGGLLTKMGVYAMIRVFTIMFEPDDFTLNLFIIIAIMTMLTGIFGTINKKNIRRLMSYLIVCHIGYLIAGIGLYTDWAFAAVIFYLIHDVIVKSNMFMITGIIAKIRETTDMTRLGGLLKDYPKFSLTAALVFFSLIGIPPFSGFWPKILFLQESFKASQWILLVLFILASFVTLFVVIRFWIEAFWKESPKPLTEEIDHYEPIPMVKKVALMFPIVFLAVTSLYIGFNADRVMELSEKTAYEIKNKEIYIKAVLQK
ncbi:proton-conducting transporter membrane subunit [Capnocytophaga sp. ARDL2]|uniref:proton-conducting transporter transmembrane domain-containing protein n=1 Tax=Capnocytophaga sp. ARDL2 TaxID=3238809 RepID=UPI003557AFC5